MSRIDEACQEVVSDVDGAVACAVVELSSGRLLGYHASLPLPGIERVIGPAVLDLLRCHPNADSRGEPAVLEAHVLSEDQYHFAKVLKGAKAALLLVTSRATNAGMGSAQMRALIPKVEPHVT